MKNPSSKKLNPDRLYERVSDGTMWEIQGINDDSIVLYQVGGNAELEIPTLEEFHKQLRLVME